MVVHDVKALEIMIFT